MTAGTGRFRLSFINKITYEKMALHGITVARIIPVMRK
jgi:hypothetical protein